MDANLGITLNNFATSVNNDVQIQRVTKAWQVNIQLECTDCEDKYLLEIKSGRVENVVVGDFEVDESMDNVILRGDKTCFSDVFQGHRNPALASLEGDLQVFGKESHNVKLDAITLILWGF